jgi:hypothetical protein
MKKVSRLFLLGAMVLVLLTAACAAEQGTTPTIVGTIVPDLETSTPLGTDATAETATTTTGELETPTLSGTDTGPTAVGTASTSTTQTSVTAVVPVTGPEIVLIECQFCVDTVAHALLVLPDTATFEITSPPTTTTTSTTSVSATTSTCTTVEVNNGRQVVLCSGPEMTPLTLNICTNGTTCTDFPVDLLACPFVETTTAVPDQTQPSGTDTGTGSSTSTSTPSFTISTPTP